MGAAPNELSVKMYSFEKDSNEAFATVTAECTPIEAHFSNGNEKHYVIFHQQSLFRLRFLKNGENITKSFIFYSLNRNSVIFSKQFKIIKYCTLIRLSFPGDVFCGGSCGYEV